jgi:hypothetical protein
VTEPERGKDVPAGEPEGTETMTAAEEAGQVAYGAQDASGETGATGAESSSG